MYDDLIHFTQENDLEAFFVTLNYDTLLEQAIVRKFTTTGVIDSFDDYCIDGRRWQLVKPHGSVNWAYATNKGRGDVDRYDAAFYEQYVAVMSEPDLERGDLAFLPPWEFELGDQLMYPALALPSDRKYGFVCPDPHARALTDFVRTGPAVLVIGTKGLDSDLMDLLRDARSDEGIEGPLIVVDPSTEVEDIAERFGDVLGVRMWSRRVIHTGFRPFVEGGIGERLLGALAEA